MDVLNDDVLNIIIDKIEEKTINKIMIHNELSSVSKRFNKLVKEREPKQQFFDRLLKCTTSLDLINFYHGWNASRKHIFKRKKINKDCCLFMSGFCDFMYLMCIELTNNLTLDNDKSYFVALVINCIKNIECKFESKYKIMEKINDGIVYKTTITRYVNYTTIHRESSSFSEKIHIHKEWLRYCDKTNCLKQCNYICEHNICNRFNDCIWCRGYECDVCHDQNQGNCRTCM